MEKQKINLSIQEVQNELFILFLEFDSFCRKNNIEYYMIGGTLLGAVRHQGFIPWDDDIDVGMTRDNYEKFLSICDSFSDKYKVYSYKNDRYCNYLLARIRIPDLFTENCYLSKNINRNLYFDIFPIDCVPDDKLIWKKFSSSITNRKKIIAYSYPRKSVSSIKNIFKFLLSIVLLPFRRLIVKKTLNLMKKYKDMSNCHYLCSLASQYNLNKQKMRFEIYGKPVEINFNGHLFFAPQNYSAYLCQLYGDSYMELPPIKNRRIPMTVVRKKDEK